MTALGLAAALPFNSTKGDPLLSLGPVFAIRAKDSVEGEQWALNKGTGGQVLRARYGSVGRAEIRRGVGLVNVGRVGGVGVVNYASIPSSAALNTIQTEIEVVVRASLDNWADYADTASMALIGRYVGTLANCSWNFGLINTSRLLRFEITDGVTNVATGSSIAVPFSNGQMVWLKVTWRKSDGRVQFWYALDQDTEPSSWTQLGTDKTLGAGLNLNTTGTDELRFMGSPAAMYYGNGVFKRGIVRGSIGGTSIVDVDFTQQNDLTTSFTCTTGQTVTVTATNAVDTNDPLLATAGENYIYIPSGSSSNNAYIPSAANLSATTQFEIIQRVWLADWTPATTSILGQRTAFTDPNYHWSLALLIGGQLRLTIFPSATVASAIQIDSTTSVPLTDGQWYWLRVTFNGNDGSGNRRTNFYYSADRASVPTSWIAIGTEVVTASTVVFTDPGSSTLLAVGANPSAPDVACKRFIYRTTIDGSNIVDIDFSLNSNQSSFVCTTGQTVTIGRSTSGRKTMVVTQPVWLFGTDDYLEVADNDLLDFNSAQDFTVVAIARAFGSTDGALVTKKTNGALSAGWWLRRVTSTNMQTLVDDGTTQIALGPTTNTDGSLRVVGFSRSGTNLTPFVSNTISSSTVDTTSGNFSNNLQLRIGATSTGILYLDGEILAVGIFRRALTAGEIAQIVQYYGAS